ncbi:hypothetical protein FRC02_008692 [Tulasnella sp. 418]|nr:hypothetical protein FRC02_008692 [Tulasnella sp. 418]
MKLPPIALFSSKTEVDYDEAGNQVLKSQVIPSSLASYSILPEYLSPRGLSSFSNGNVPSLSFCCFLVYIKYLSTSERGAFLDELPPPRPYGANITEDEDQDQATDLLQQLIPHMHPRSKAVNWRLVDPRLWVTIIRLFWTETLPETFLDYELPLADPHLPYMQMLEPSSHFTLITVLNLSNKRELTDDSIVALKSLHLLVVLDVSSTKVTAKGVRKLAEALTGDEEGDYLQGPWRLRVLSLRGCREVDSIVEQYLAMFPLLSVIDLRSTQCSALTSIVGWSARLSQENHSDLYYPAPISDMIKYLQELASHHDVQLFESPQPPLTIHISKLYHPRPDKPILEFSQSSGKETIRQRAEFPAENGYLVLAPDGSMGIGDSARVERKRAELERIQKKVNKLDRSGKLPEDSWIRDEYYNQLNDAKQALIVRNSPSFHKESRFFPDNLHDAQADADRDYSNYLKEKADAKTRRLEREAVQYARDTERLSADERLQRQMVLIRVPPDWNELEKAAKKRITLQKRFEATKEAKRALSTPSTMKASADSMRTGEAFLEVASRSNKKRKMDSSEMWNSILKGNGGSQRSEITVDIGFKINSSQSSSKSSRNPFSKKPSVDPKKVIRKMKS